MYHVSAQGVDERMITVHYYYYYQVLMLLRKDNSMVYTQSQHIDTNRKTTNESIKFDRNTLPQPTFPEK